MYIRQLRIESFQSHKDTTLNFHPNMNCIIGTGNSGKSSIVRALSFILFGEWNTSWVRHGASFCRITLTTDSNIEIVREKGIKVNKYVVKIPGQTDQTYENFGTQVPEEVSTLLQIFKAQIGDKEELNLNLSNQLDQLFLLSNPGSYKAKVLGKLSKAHYLDYVLKDINREKKRLSFEKTVIEKETEILQKELEQYVDLDLQKEYLNTVENRLEMLERVVLRLEKLKNLLGRVSAWKTTYTQLKTDLAALQVVSVVNLESVQGVIDRLKQLRDLYDKVTQFKNSYNSVLSLKDDLDKTKKLLAEKYVSVLQKNQKCPICLGDITSETLEKILGDIGC